MIAPTVNASTTQEAKITPSQKRKLLTRLKVMEDLHTQKKALEMALEVEKQTVEEIRLQIGANNIEIVDERGRPFKVAYVTPVRSALDKEMLLHAGVSMSQIEAGTKITPVKPYTKVSYPGLKEKD